MNKTELSLTSLLILLLVTTASAQSYLDLRQDGFIYDVDVVVFARQLSQPAADSINNKASVKTDDVIVLPTWDREQDLFQYPEIAEPPIDTVPIENQANPIKVLSDVVLSTSMNHAIIKRLQANPTFKPIYRQKWRQMPSAFSRPRYIEVSSLPAKNAFNQDGLSQSNFYEQVNFDDYNIDGQVAFSKQRFTHLHVKMNLFRLNAENQQITYEISQQKRIELGEWQYFDHQQFGVLAKVTAVKLAQRE